MRFENLQDGQFGGPSQILDRNDFSNSECQCRFDVSHQVWAQSALRFWRRYCLNNSKMAIVTAILDVGME